MTDAQRQFFELLRAGMEPSVPSSASSQTYNWTEILRIAREQTVLGTIYRGMQGVPEQELPDTGKRMSLMVSVDRLSRASRKVSEIGEKLEKIFPEAVLMKGPRSARHYPQPDLRTSGDIDLYFPEEYYDKALETVRNLGIEPVQDSGAWMYTFEGVIVEHHHRFYDLHTKVSKLPGPGSSEGELLQLSSHILKHAMRSGIGLRQICDFALACRALSYDKDSFSSALHKAGISRWNDVLCSFCEQYLGSREDGLPHHKKVNTDFLFSEVMSGGNFGMHDSTRKAGKKGTAAVVAKKLSWSIKIAPKETLGTIIDLVARNLQTTRK